MAMEEETNRKCPECGEKIVGRSDKKFCDSNCRNNFNNRHKSDDEQLIIRQNSGLRRNRKILKLLCPNGKATVRKEVLDSMQYDYTLFTGLYITQEGQIYYLCYDFAFAAIVQRNIDKVLIVNRQSYMDHFNPWKYINKNG